MIINFLIIIQDEYEKIETAFGDTYPLIGADEGGDLYGNIETGTQIYIRTARIKYVRLRLI